MRLAYLILPLLATALLAAPAQADHHDGHSQGHHGTGHVQAQHGGGHDGHIGHAQRHHRPVMRWHHGGHRSVMRWHHGGHRSIMRWRHGGHGFAHRRHHSRHHAAARMLNPNIVLNQLFHRHWRPFGRIGFHGDRYTVHAHDRHMRPWELIINGFSGQILHRRRLF